MCSNVDVLIVGAGPSGSTAAIEATKGNAHVLLIDKKKQIGIPVQCAEYIPKLLLKEISISKRSIEQEIDGMRTYVDNILCNEL